MRVKLSLFIVLVVPFFIAGLAEAHGRTNNPYAIGIGFSFGAYGPYPGPAFGVYPLYYPGFYGNGISMYGPPVPTYAPVPGTFGASDNTVIQNAPLLGVPLGFSFHAPPAPLPAAPAEGAPLALDPKMLGLRIEDKMIIVEVRLPLDNAAVFFNDQFIGGRGLVRLFSSPATLEPAAKYQYSVRAEWIIDGFKTSKSLKVSGTPGQRLIADFTK